MSAQQSLQNLCSNYPLPNNLRLNDPIPAQYHPLWEGMTWFCLYHNASEDERTWDGERSWALIKRDDPLANLAEALGEDDDDDDEDDDEDDNHEEERCLIENAMDAIDEFSGNWSDDEMVNACESLGIETVDAQE
tara:strand:+ start:56 stop:460 length:405 start_codon:yes stop_codon:yes gene_type:complete